MICINSNYEKFYDDKFNYLEKIVPNDFLSNDVY